ncbi:MAG TPA: gliding motility-associated C-terminal domain-containing protein [Chitinophagaceae bacterium]|nr:gliding motility-associated C-terminal domain-containing protein [Chitinophagaceae bacterium]
MEFISGPNLVRTLKQKLVSSKNRPLKIFYLLVFLMIAGLGKADAAEIYSNVVYKGIGTSYGANTQSIQISAATQVAGTNFSFISLDPSDPLFYGNNVPGYFTYKNSSGVLVSIKGMVTRAFKQGNVGQGAYFYVLDANDQPTGEAYLFVFPGFESLFPGAGSFSTASSGVSDVLNVVLLESPRIDVTGTLTAIAGCGGQASAPQSVTVNGSNLTANIIVTAPTGYEISLTSGSGYTNSITLTPTGGTVPTTTIYVRLSASASNGATGDVTFSSTGAASRTVNTGVATITGAPTISVSPASPSNYPGGPNTITASGADTYTWSPATALSATTGATVIASPLVNTTYTVTGTTTLGCIGSTTVTVTVGPSLTGGTIAADQSICINTTPAALTSTGTPTGGSGSYSYQWQVSTDNVSFVDWPGATAPGYAPGVLNTTRYYRRKVNDGVVDAYSNTVTITVNELPVVSVSPASATIFPGGNTSLTASGASTYVWSPSTDLSASTGATVTASPAVTTTYTVTGTSSAGCSSSTTVTVTVGAGLAAGTIIANQEICKFKTPATLTSSANASGGSGTYTYQWESSTDNVNFTDIAGANATDYSPSALSATTYFRRKVGDGIVDLYSNTVTITVFELPLLGILPPSSTIYPGGSVVLNAFGASTYTWSPATGLSATTGATVTAAPTVTTTYTVTGTSEQGCTATATSKVNMGPALLGGTVTANQSICTGTAPAAFASTKSATGGAGIYNYQWQSSTDNVTFTDIAGATTTTYAPGVLTATTYYRRQVKDFINTAYSNVLTVTVNELPVIGITPGSVTIYPGEVVALTAFGGSTYTWSPATGLSATTGTTVNASPAVATEYTVTGVSAAGCSKSETVLVNVGPALAAGTIAASQAICSGTAPAALTSATDATGGSATYTYQWQSSSDNVSYADISGANTTVYAPGTLTATTYYRRKVSDAVGSAYSDTVTITVNPLPVMAVSPASANIFPLGNVALTASGADTYSWAPATGLSATTGATVTAAPAATTTYTVTGTTTAGCVDSVTVTVTVGAALDAGTISANQTICNNITPAALSSATAATGGSGTYTYQWQSSTDNVNFTDIAGATSDSYAPGNLSATTYFRRKASDAVTSALSNTVTITVNLLPVMSVSPAAPTIFPLGTVALTASGANTYSWAPATGLSATTGATVTASPAATTIYTVTGTAVGGCIDSVKVTVTVSAALDGGAIAASQTICKSTAPAALTSTTAATGGSGTYTYQWQSSTDNITFTDIAGATSAGYAPGTLTQTTYYRRKVSDAVTSVLSNTVTITVSVVTKPTVTAAGATTFCTGGSVVLNGSTATTYAWYKNGTAIAGATTQSYTATASGRYVLITTNVDNCKSDSSNAITVIANDPPAAPAAISGDTVVIARYPYSYTATPSAGATSYIWTLPSGWSGTSTTNSINATSGSSSGNITVIAVANGCNSPATTLKVRVKYENVTIPDVITPNGDGFNDRWVILKPAGMKVKASIFNRWGQQVYKSDDYRNDWNGTGTGGFLGNNLPNGTYFYVVELSGAGINGTEIRKGSITLKRD